MPLHAEAERRRRPLDRFDDAVGRDGGHHEGRRDAADGLVMAAVDGTRLEPAPRPSDAASRVPGRHAHRVRDVILRARRPRDSASIVIARRECPAPACRPPATFSTCTPRQIAKSGMSRATASRDSGISNLSRVGVDLGRRVRRLAVHAPDRRRARRSAARRRPGRGLPPGRRRCVEHHAARRRRASPTRRSRRGASRA